VPGKATTVGDYYYYYYYYYWALGTGHWALAEKLSSAQVASVWGSQATLQLSPVLYYTSDQVWGISALSSSNLF
jgi:hypothetical protein